MVLLEIFPMRFFHFSSLFYLNIVFSPVNDVHLCLNLRGYVIISALCGCMLVCFVVSVLIALGYFLITVGVNIDESA